MLRDGNSKQCINNLNISAEAWYDYYSHLFESQNTSSDNLNSDSLSFINNTFDCSFLNEQISDQEIVKSAKSFNKSPGPDGNSVEMYKEILVIILPYLNKLFNTIFDSGNIPESWCNSIITQIYKNGSK